MGHAAIERWQETRGWTLPAGGEERLGTLLELWVRYGAVMNLSGARTEEELLPHVLDGLDTAWLVERAAGPGRPVRWMDFGSGGGFPALVVAAVSDWAMLLLEPRQKRASFLELALGAIGRGSIQVERGRFERSTWSEKAASEFFSPVEDGFRVVSARAVWDPKTWLENARHVVGTGGHVVIHLSRAESPQNFALATVVEGELGWVGLVDVGARGEVR